MLITYFVETHYSRVENVSYVGTFDKLKQRYGQLQREQLHCDSLAHRYSTLSHTRHRAAL